MAKYGQLWDDSALVKALDDAISKYKKMHIKGGDNEEEKITNGTEEIAPNILNEISDQVQPQDTDNTYVNAESTEHYNLLLNQYNAVEEERQKLLHQLYQYGNWDSQGYNYNYDSQYHNVSAVPQTSVCCCQPYVCPYSTAVGDTTLGHNGKSVSVQDDDFIKAAMAAVNKAISSVNIETSGTPDVDQEGEKTSQTDLSVVLNAWFSAGFYTGKYLSEEKK